MTKLQFTTLLFLLIVSANLNAQSYERYKKLTDTTVVSKHLGFKKNITITVPKEWQRNVDRKFPLIIVFDRQNNRSHNYILQTIDYLTSNEQMPSAVIVSIESEDDEYRVLETVHKPTVANGLALENEQFLFEELIPLLEKDYKTSTFRLFIGHSRYGYFTTSLLKNRIHQLNAVIAISPPFNEKNVNLVDSVATLKTQNFDSHKYFRFATGGERDFAGDFHKMDSLFKSSDPGEISGKGILFKEADHNVTPGLAISTSLYEIFEKWSESQNKFLENNVLDLSVADSLEKEIESFYGSNLKFSIGVLNGKGWYYYSEGKYEKAIETWKLLLESYPNFSNAYIAMIYAKIELKQDYTLERKLLKQSLKTSENYSKEEKKEILMELKEITK